jgi:uncharacterized membrane protein
VACHQWPFRSFFVFGPQPTYTRDHLAELGLDPFRFVGNPGLGWKMAFCERNLATVLGVLVFGLVYAARRRRAEPWPLGWLGYGVLITPMALDGFTQLVGWRESIRELRLITGGLFGVASTWFLYGRLPDRQYRDQPGAVPGGRRVSSGRAPLGTAGG